LENFQQLAHSIEQRTRPLNVREIKNQFNDLGDEDIRLTLGISQATTEEVEKQSRTPVVSIPNSATAAKNP